MKRRIIINGCFLFLIMSCICYAKESYIPKEGYAPDAKTAIKIAEAVLVPIYGKKTINCEKPLKAELIDGIWHVTGTMPKGFTLGGVATIEINKMDGKISNVIHGE